MTRYNPFFKSNHNTNWFGRMNVQVDGTSIGVKITNRKFTLQPRLAFLCTGGAVINVKQHNDKEKLKGYDKIQNVCIAGYR